MPYTETGRRLGPPSRAVSPLLPSPRAGSPRGYPRGGAGRGGRPPFAVDAWVRVVLKNGAASDTFGEMQSPGTCKEDMVLNARCWWGRPSLPPPRVSQRRDETGLQG